MRRSTLRRCGLALVVPITALSVAFTAGPASAGGSAAGIASNAWIIGDLAVQAGGALNTTPAGDSTIPAGVWDQGRTATTTTIPAQGTGGRKPFGLKPKPGRLGLILNTVAVAGGLIAMWPGGEDAPALPMPSTNELGTFGTMPSTGTCGAASGLINYVGCPGANQLDFRMPSSARPWSINNKRWGVTIYPTGVVPPAVIPDGMQSGMFNGGESPSGYIQGAISRPLSTETQASYDAYWIRCTGETFPACTTDQLSLGGRVLVAPRGTDYASPAGPITDPAAVPRTIETTANCVNSVSGIAQTIIAATTPFYINPGTPSEMPETEDVKCPAGHWLESAKRELQTAGSTEKVAIGAPYTAPSWVPQQVGDFPNCYPAGDTMCRLSLNKIDVTPRYACDSIPVGAGGHPCASWASDPNRATRYDCTFGTYPVALDRCGAYKDSFKKGQTGQVTSTTTMTSVLPAPAEADGSVDPTPEATPDLGDCTPSWAGVLNPFWVFKAASCAIAWAFTPPPGYFDTKVGTLRDQWGATAPALWSDRVRTLIVIPGATGCNGIPINYDLGPIPLHMDMGKACPGDKLATAAGVVKVGLSAVVIIGGGFACLRVLGAGFGWTPAIGGKGEGA